MRLSDFKTYWKFLTRNKVYTLVSVVGFSISLMFVITLGLYVKEQLSVDDFQANKDRIFLMSHDYEAFFGNTVAPTLQQQFPDIEAFVRVHDRDVNLGRKGSEKVRVHALFADSSFFNVFSVRLLEGNASQVLKGNQSAVVSTTFANTYYQGKDPMGNSLIVDDIEYVVTGVMEDMSYNSMLPQADFILSFRGITHYWGGDWVIDTSDHFGFTSFLLAKEGSDLPAKASGMLEILKQEINVYREGFFDKLELVPLKEAYFNIKTAGNLNLRTNSFSLVTVYIGIALLILIIALLNYINLTVAQAGFRGKEAAIKKLIGSTRKSLVLTLLIESLIMATCTFAIGLFLAFLAEPFFNNVLNTKLELKSLLTPSMIAGFVVFIFFIAFVAGILPALFISSFNPIEVVKGTFSRKMKSSYSKVLITFQYTIAIVLLICSFFVKEQFEYLLHYDMGYNREGILEMPYLLDVKEQEGIKAELYGIPGVELVSLSCGTPIVGGNNNSWEKDGELYSFHEFRVDSAFFKIYGISIMESTGISSASQEVNWLDKKAYNTLNPDPLTGEAEIWFGRKIQVAGIVSDFNVGPLRNEEKLPMRINMRHPDDRPWNIIVKLASGTDYYKTAKLIEETYSRYSGGEFIEANFVSDSLQRYYTREKNTSDIMMAFTGLTIVIMIMGVFAMSMYIIRQKQKEISLRKINGSTESRIMLELNSDSLKRVLFAFIIACPIAYYIAAKWLQNFAYRISVDWQVFVLAGGVVAVLTLLSVSGMIRNAARSNPIKYLRSE